MTTSYPPKGARVNTRTAKSSRPAAPASAAPAPPAPRVTATFEPYFWEAYNEIVQPHRFDHYLIRKWLPTLGPAAFAVVKTLRDHCYYNPSTGVLRNSYEMSMDELAEASGVSRATLFRLFTQSEELAHFVRRIEQHKIGSDGKPKQDKNRFLVCMDTPIHPDDMERYDDLRAIKEQERNVVPGRIVKGKDGSVSYVSQNETHSENGKKQSPAYESQFETHSKNDTPYESQIETPDTTYLQSQNETPDTTYLQSQNETALVKLPSGGYLPLGSVTPSAAPVINNAPKGGAGINAGYVYPAWWIQALPKLEEAMSKPTFQTHILALMPVGLTAGAGNAVEAALECPSAFTREWIEKRHIETLENALASVLDCIVTVRLTQASAAPKEAINA